MSDPHRGSRGLWVAWQLVTRLVTRTHKRRRLARRRVGQIRRLVAEIPPGGEPADVASTRSLLDRLAAAESLAKRTGEEVVARKVLVKSPIGSRDRATTKR